VTEPGGRWKLDVRPRAQRQLAQLGLATFFLPACNSATVAYQMAITPDRLQARMYSAMNFGVTALMPLAPLTGGLLLTKWGGRTALLLLATLAVAGAAALIASRELRNLPIPDRWDLSEVPEAELRQA